MFEHKKDWSNVLKTAAQKFLENLIRGIFTWSEFEQLLDQARSEGFDDARETVNDWYQPEPPERDEDC
jgi:hypothetical protein